MGCCGRNRPVQRVEDSGPPRVTFTHGATTNVQYFEYIGKTGLTVLGPITGRRYRFTHPGAKLAIDGRDGPSMTGVPNLRRAETPE